MIDEAVDKRLRDVCFELENHYQDLCTTARI